MQKYRKNHLGKIAPSLLKAVFKFLNIFADLKSRRLNEILLRLSSLNCIFVCFFFCKSAFGLVVCFFLQKGNFFH